MRVRASVRTLDGNIGPAKAGLEGTSTTSLPSVRITTGPRKMYEANVERVLSMIRPGDVVLDIGGWACPFNRATHVMDVNPYETRGFYARAYYGWPASQGG